MPQMRAKDGGFMGLDIAKIEEIIKEHMTSQPEKATCSECGELLDFSQEVDAWCDLQIIVHPCECQKLLKEG